VLHSLDYRWYRGKETANESTLKHIISEDNIWMSSAKKSALGVYRHSVKGTNFSRLIGCQGRGCKDDCLAPLSNCRLRPYLAGQIAGFNVRPGRLKHRVKQEASDLRT
jgi:hypothetical protein